MEPEPRRPALFVGHGAAVLTTSPSDPTHRFLSAFAATVDSWRPKAVVVVSAHFIASPIRVTGRGQLETLHDHPARTVYGYRYPGRGDVGLTARLVGALSASGWACAVAADRGLDHGAWVPLSLLRPRGDLPVAQVSLPAGISPSESVALGSALSALRSEGMLLLGSGGVTHNFGRGTSPRGTRAMRRRSRGRSTLGPHSPSPRRAAAPGPKRSPRSETSRTRGSRTRRSSTSFRCWGSRAPPATTRPPRCSRATSTDSPPRHSGSGSCAGTRSRAAPSAPPAPPRPARPSRLRGARRAAPLGAQAPAARPERLRPSDPATAGWTSCSPPACSVTDGTCTSLLNSIRTHPSELCRTVR